MAWAQFCGFSEKLDFEVEKLDSIVLAEKTQFCVFSRKYDFFLFWWENMILRF